MQPFTIVTLKDEEGDEFPIRLPGCYPSNRGADIEAALQILQETKEFHPKGEVTCTDIEYVQHTGSVS
jgi:predicted RNase H-like HicB family nuclease